MRNPSFSVNLEQESQSIQIDSDPNLQFVEKSLCNRCQQYLDEGLRLTEHLKTCSPMYITTIPKKEKVFNSTKDNSENSSSIKKVSKVKVVKSDRRRTLKEQENGVKKKKLGEEQDIALIEDDNLTNTRVDSIQNIPSYNNNLNDSQHLNKPGNTRRSSTRQSLRISSSLSRSNNDKSSTSSPAALYKRKLSEAHEAKRDNSEESSRQNGSRKKPKKNYLEIPSETTFKANVIKEEDKSKPICARTRSSKVKSSIDTKDVRISRTVIKDKGKKIMDDVPEGTKEIPMIAPTETEGKPVESEEIVLMTRSRRKKRETIPIEPRLRKKSIVNKIEEKQKEIINKKKNIPRKKPLNIIIPPKSTTKKYPNLPSPIHTITRSKGTKVDTSSEKSESPTQNSDKESPIDKLSKVGKQIRQEDLIVLDTVLGEGQVGTVNLAKYKGLLVACKSKRVNTRVEPFYYQIQRELKYAADLSVCRYINKYIGWVYCPRYKVERGITDARVPKLYVIQKYIANGDARSYLDGRESTFRPCEAVQAAICLFSALTDAHSIGIGIVDLKLENFLIDSSGAGWLTDFGSCIEFYDREQVDLDDEEVAWTTNVAAPEMIDSHMFSKASDVFMATLIVAELLTVELSDKQFYTQVLKRRRSSGSVHFSSTLLHRRYSDFFPLLEQGLANNPKDRPSAKDMLNSFILLRTKIIQL